MTNFLKFIRIASPIAASTPEIDIEVDELASIYQWGDGFLAFESAFHIYSLRGTHSLDRINSLLWKEMYLAGNLFFFAQDTFAHQYGIDRKTKSFFKLDLETGVQTKMADTLEQFFEIILKDFEYQTGWPLAHQWQSTHSPLSVGRRLCPIIPFMANGEFEVGNLFEEDMFNIIAFFSDWHRQTKHLPDGTQISIDVGD